MRRVSRDPAIPACWVLGRGAAREARASKIERAPKEVDRAHLASKASAEHVEDPSGLQQDAPESLHVFRVVFPVGKVLIEGNGLCDFNRHLPDPDGRLKAIERDHNLLIEICHRRGPKINRGAPVVAGLQYQNMPNEVEIDLQEAVTVRHWGRCEAANGGVERHIPCVIDGRRKCQPHLANDLGPKLQCGAAFAPRSLRQSGPHIIEAHQRREFIQLHRSWIRYRTIVSDLVLFCFDFARRSFWQQDPRATVRGYRPNYSRKSHSCFTRPRSRHLVHTLTPSTKTVPGPPMTIPGALPNVDDPGTITFISGQSAPRVFRKR